MKTAKNTFEVDVITLEDIARHAGDRTNTAIANRMGTNRNTVANVISGKIKPSAEFMYAFVKAYKVEPELAGKIFFNDNLRTA